MVASKLILFFVQGFLVGSGPCLLTCAPLLLPYIAGTDRTWQEGLRSSLIFGLTRLVVYTLLGGVVGYIGAFLFPVFYGSFWGRMIWALAAIFIMAVGGLMLLGRSAANPVCRYFRALTPGGRAWSPVILGLLVALAPCLPLLAVLTEIMFAADRFYLGFLYGAAFGLGTAFSPLLVLGAVTPLLGQKLAGNARRLEIAGAVFLILFGLYILLGTAR
jgi:sulfite exporter TauE/SafE